MPLLQFYTLVKDIFTYFGQFSFLLDSAKENMFDVLIICVERHNMNRLPCQHGVTVST